MIEELFTIIELVFISNSNDIDTSEFEFIFGSGETIKELDELNSFILQEDNHLSKVYYCEEITIKYKGNLLYSFHFLIYRKKINTIILDLDEKNRPSFELLFYTKDQSLNPKSVKYKNIEYNQLENYENKYRSRIFFASVDPEQMQYVNSEAMTQAQHHIKFDNNESYHTIMRIPSQNKMEISVTKMSYYYDINEEISGVHLLLSNDDLETLGKNLNEFSNKYDEFLKCYFLSKEKKNQYLSELSELSDKITSDELYLYIDNPTNVFLDINILDIIKKYI